MTASTVKARKHRRRALVAVTVGALMTAALTACSPPRRIVGSARGLRHTDGRRRRVTVGTGADARR